MKDEYIRGQYRMSNLIWWFKTLISGEPHFKIGGTEDPYMLRWYVIPRNKLFNIYIHKFLRDDNDEALHDHPWWFLSFMLKGKYREYVDEGIINRSMGSFAFRKATHRHRVALHRIHGKVIPCWTLIATGKVTREWGFHCPKGWVSFKEFTKRVGNSNIGLGCE